MLPLSTGVMKLGAAPALTAVPVLPIVPPGAIENGNPVCAPELLLPALATRYSNECQPPWGWLTGSGSLLPFPIYSTCVVRESSLVVSLFELKIGTDRLEIEYDAVGITPSIRSWCTSFSAPPKEIM